MRLTHRQLDYIREVAAKGSISDARKTLRVSLSLVIAAISVAEDANSTRILTRHVGPGV